MNNQDTEVVIEPSSEIVANISQQLADNRERLRNMMTPFEFNHILPLIESYPMWSGRTIIYSIVADAYRIGYNFNSANTLPEVIDIYAKYLIEKRNKEALL